MYSFDYRRPADRAAALADHAGDARYLAGGQSLVQAMKLRLSSCERLIDLGALAELRGIRDEAGEIVIGAMSTHAQVAASPLVRSALPALAELAAGIGDPMVRSIGTIGGSIANADPAACYPAAVLALRARVRTDRRTIDGDRFFTGVFETALQPGELITALHFTPLRLAAYVKLRQPASRFALVGVFVCRDAAGVRVAVTGAKGCVFRAEAIERALEREFTPQAAAAVRLASDAIADDLHAPAAYRAAMISVAASRAVAAALAR